MNIRAIVLAAGQSVRFKTKKTKLLFDVCGRPMILHPLMVLQELGLPVSLVLSNKTSAVKDIVSELGLPQLAYVDQSEQLGTGHAVQCSRATWDQDNVLILYGDMPLVTKELLLDMQQKHAEQDADVTFLSTYANNPHGYGRVIELEAGYKIVEEKDCNEQERAVELVNAGIYLIKRSFLEEYIDSLDANNASQEFYLTDLVGKAAAQDKKTQMIKVAYDDVRGVNTLKQLWEVEQIKRARIIHHWMREGVRFEFAQTTHVDCDVEIGADTVIGAGVQLLGKTIIGQECQIKQYSVVENSKLADGARVLAHSVVNNSRVGSNTVIGPFAHLNTNATIGRDSHIGNFVEVKNSTVGYHSKAKHLTYLGNARLGDHVNVGAGTITCNYDGISKHETVIKDNVFVGSNSTIIAPVHIEKDAYVAAGSTINRNVPEKSLAIARERQTNKPGYAEKLRQGKAPDTSGSSSDTENTYSFKGAVKTDTECKQNV